MRFFLFIFSLVILLSCSTEPNSENIIKNLQKEDTAGIQFNPAHTDPAPDPANGNCKSVDGDMGSGEECELKGTTIIEEYQKLIREEYIDGIQGLPDTIPNGNKAVEINPEGLRSAEYKWEEKNKLTITLNYDGGVTEIHLVQTGKNLLRTIYYSAD